MRKADEAEKAYQQNYQQQLASSLQGDPSGIADRLQATGNPRLTELAAQLRIQQAQQAAAIQQRQAAQILTPEAEAQRIRIEQAKGLKTPEEVQQAQQLRMLTPEEMQQKIQIAQASRAPEKPQAPTLGTVIDPNNPDQLLQIDARTYQPGGSVGAPGVLGVAAKMGDAAKNKQKLEQAKPAAKIRADTVTSASDRLISSLDELSSSPGLSHITGMVAGRTPTFSQEGRNAQALLENIKARAFVDTLQAMREASKTGGAVGNVSDREGDRLQNAAAALEQSQDTETFKLRLGELKQVAKDAKDRLQRAYSETYGDDEAGSGSSIDDLLNKYK